MGEQRPPRFATRAGSLDRGTEVWLPTALLHVRDYLTGDVDPKCCRSGSLSNSPAKALFPPEPGSGPHRPRLSTGDPVPAPKSQKNRAVQADPVFEAGPVFDPVFRAGLCTV